MGAADRSASTVSPGTTLGPYQILRELGRGAFGAVFEARKLSLEKRVALKLLLAAHADDANVRARFLQEARAAASLRHPHIVDVDDVGEIDGTPFLAMEFLDGESLQDRLDRSGPMRPADALDLLLPVCSAVAAAHDKGIVHRDIKPDNIFLWQAVPGQDHPKLLDFGIAKMTNPMAASLTASGTAMGTPRYMSPEQWGSGKSATGRSDQWALAVILYRCLAGREAFEAEELPALMMRISIHPHTPLRAVVPDAPPGIDAVIDRALQKAPEDRFPSVREFARALLPFAPTDTQRRWSADFGAPAAVSAPAMEDTLIAPPPRVSLPQGTLEVPELQAPGAKPPDTLEAAVGSPPPPRVTSSRPPRRWVRAALAAVAALGLALVALALSLGDAPPVGSPPRATSAPPAAPNAAVVRPPQPPPPRVTHAATPPAPSAPHAAGPAARAVLQPTAPVTATAPAPAPARGRHHRGRERENVLIFPGGAVNPAQPQGASGSTVNGIQAPD